MAITLTPGVTVREIDISERIPNQNGRIYTSESFRDDYENMTNGIVTVDNGVGFDLNMLDKKEGIGIRQIEARVQLMAGDFKIESMLDKGTQIEISIPTIEVEKQVVNV